MSKRSQFIYENYKINADMIVSNRKCCTKYNCLQFCKKFLHFMISRVGLMIVMIGYVLGGGLVFEALESDYENKALLLNENVLEKMLLKIYKQIENNSTRVRDESFYNFLQYEIRNFSDFFTNATLNGTLTGHIDRQWDFFGSVFYCVTLVSTIGYGHITCKTNFGKLFTIIYSAIGVPLMMLFLANTGSSTGSLFRFFYVKIDSIKRQYNSYKKKKEREIVGINASHENFDQDILSDLDKYDKENSYDIFFNELNLINNRKNENRPLEKKVENSSSISKIDSISNKDKTKQFISKIKKEKKQIETKSDKENDNKAMSFKIGIHDCEVMSENVNQFLISISQMDKTKNNNNENTKMSYIIAPQPLKKKKERFDNIENQQDIIKRVEYLIDQKSLTDDDCEDDKYLGNIKDNDFYDNQVENKHLFLKNVVKTSLNKEIKSEKDSIINYEGLNCGEIKKIHNDDFDKDSVVNDNDYLLNRIFSSEIKKISSNSQINSPNVFCKPKSSSLIEHKNKENMTKNQESNRRNKLTSSKSDIELENMNYKKKKVNRKKKEYEDKSSRLDNLKLFARTFTLKFKKNQKETKNDGQEKNLNVISNSANVNHVFHEETKHNVITTLNSNWGKKEENFYSNNNNEIPDTKSLQNESKKYSLGFLKANQTLGSSKKIQPQYNSKQLTQLYRKYQHEKNKRVGVPILTILSILICYLFAGMFIFSSLENWGKLDAFYFCFTTLFTIGFGDLIPGSTLLNKNGNNNNLYISALYIFIGLILIAMSVNLVNQQIKSKIKSIARKIGLTNC